LGAPGAFMSRAIPASAAWLGGLGLLPFAAAALLSMIGADAELRELAMRAFIAYSAVILAFLGGVRWGAALGDAQWRPLMLSVLPSLIACACLLIAPLDAIKILAAVYGVIGFFDVMRRPAPEWPAWFMKLRARLSGAVVVIHLALLVALTGQV